MPFLIPLLVGAAGTGWIWWKTTEEKEKTFSDEFFEIMKPVLIAFFVILLLRWMYVKGTAQEEK